MKIIKVIEQLQHYVDKDGKNVEVDFIGLPFSFTPELSLIMCIVTCPASLSYQCGVHSLGHSLYQ